jgi:hypothetical protein
MGELPFRWGERLSARARSPSAPITSAALFYNYAMSNFAVGQYCRDIWALTNGATNCELQGFSAVCRGVSVKIGTFNGPEVELPLTDPQPQTSDNTLGGGASSFPYNQLAKTSIQHSWTVLNAISQVADLPKASVSVDPTAPSVAIDFSREGKAAEQLANQSEPLQRLFSVPAGRKLTVTAYATLIKVPALVFTATFTVVGGGVAIIHFGEHTVENRKIYLGETCQRGEELHLPVQGARVVSKDTIEVTCAGSYAGAFFQGFLTRVVLT